MPSISIVIPCYNAEAWVAETVQSILDQTVTDWEMLLINDGSRDGTLELLESYTSDPRIRCLDLRSNMGIAAARNIGTFQTDGEFLMHMDADDLLVPSALQDHLDNLERAEVSYSGYTAFDESPKKPLFTFLDRLPEGGELHAIVVDAEGPASWWLPPGAVTVRREADTRARQRFEVWDRRFPVAGELHYYACLFRDGAVFSPTDKVGIFHRKHLSSDSASSSFYGMSVGYVWFLDFWIKELGADAQLVGRKAKMHEAIRVAAKVERDFAAAELESM